MEHKKGEVARCGERTPADYFNILTDVIQDHLCFSKPNKRGETDLWVQTSLFVKVY